MSRRRLSIVSIVLLLIISIIWPVVPVAADEPEGGSMSGLVYKEKITFADKLAAAANMKAAKAALARTGVVRSTALVTGADGKLVPDYFGTANWANSPALTKFIDALPGLGPTAANALGQYIPVAVADTTTYPGSDYYEIAVVEYEEQMHSELPPTRMRGYVQISTTAVPGAHVALANPDLSPILMPDGSQAYGVDTPHYLGPAIVAMGAMPGGTGTPVRIKFYNLLPVGVKGELFLPMDNTVMGAGMGPDGMTEYTQNRATVHLHGNNSVWISDGTPHQWITPADETTPYPKGVSVVDVPDMAAPGDGAMTIFYTNAMSARLQFYHDHSMGITRLNVYAGEAAAYVITDVVEQDLINGTNNSGVNPGLLNVLPDIGTPLVIQDRTWVDPATIGTTDPTWLDPLQTTFGTTPGTPHAGDLWYPHIYVPAQNPWDITGTNPYGRWMYGPWFYPPTANIDHGTVPNPYYNPVTAPWEPPQMPGTPNPSMPGEAFMDTMVVNGTAYPFMTVDPKAYRFRILNASNDRFINLSLYKATGIVGSMNLVGGGSGYTADPVVTITPGAGDTTGHGAEAFATVDLDPASPNYQKVVAVTITVVGSQYTANPIVTIAPPTVGVQATATATFFTNNASGFGSEVGMVPVTGTGWLPPFDMSGVPDPAMAGPDWIQIGTEGGFLPAPVVIPAQPITWNTNPTTFNFGTVNGHSLLLGTAERADVIVDFSAYAGQTLILYNDAPAAFPAAVPTYDYYTNDQDLTGNGGAPTTPPGVGPNTRTVMQIRVGSTVTVPVPDVTLANLETVWAKTGAKRGVFEVSQDPIIVPQAAYNSAYNKTFTSAPAEEYLNVNQYTKTFTPIDADGNLQAPITMPVQLKGAHDEMGGVYDTGYGRMSGMFGLEIPASTSSIAMFVSIPYASPPVSLVAGSMTGSLVGSLDDGTQIWALIHNGVDTHTVHTHLFNVQILNRAGWDGIMLPPDPNELGWKETFRMNPLEQVFFAVRPTLPTVAQVPFLDQVPNSVRLIDPTMPVGATLVAPPPAGWFDPNGVSIASVTNHYVNYGWEYVYHCHILAHEEMDMMNNLSFAVPPAAPSALGLNIVAGDATLTWTDNSAGETGFEIQRADDAAFTTGLTTFSVNKDVTTYLDDTIVGISTYYYQVQAVNVVGDTTTYAAPSAGFPKMTARSPFSNTAVASATVPVITTASLPNGDVGVPYSQTLAASGGTAPYTWSLSAGILPLSIGPLVAGLSLDATTGVISGTPSVASTSNFTARVTDSLGATATRALSIVINGAPVITTTSLGGGDVGVAYNQTLAATGGTAPLTWSVAAGSLPAGLALNAATGAITGTPTAAATSIFAILVTDSVGGSDNRILSIIVNPAPAIATSTLPNGQVGQAYSRTVVGSGGTTAYTWSVSAGSLPAGLALNAASGVISGTPSAAGVSGFTAMLTDAVGGTATRALSITIVAGPAISTVALPVGDVGLAYSQAIAATGGTLPYTWTLAVGSLPAGLALNATTGIVSGTPTTAGSAFFTIQVTDNIGATATQALSITINPAIAIVTTSLGGGDIGFAYSQNLTKTGGTDPSTWSLASGALPAGVTLDGTTGVISGTPTTALVSSFSIRVTDSLGSTVTRALSITIRPAPVITTASLPTGRVGFVYSQPVASTGGTVPFTWSVSAGALPAGLSLNATTGAITGTPTAAGVYSFSLLLADGVGATAAQALTIIVNAGPLSITTASLVGGEVGIPYSRTIAGTGGVPAYAWSLSAGALPAGLTLNGTTGVISGTPTTLGTSTFTVLLTDSLGSTAMRRLSIRIRTAPTVTTATLVAGRVGTRYSGSLRATGGTTPYAWSVSVGALPAGLALNATTGRISGTPTTAGTFNFTALVTDAAGGTATRALSILVNPGILRITTFTITGGDIGVAYSRTVAATGGVGPYTWSIPSGLLPAGLSLAGGTGVISGTPTTLGLRSFSIRVTDSVGGTTMRTLYIRINAAPTISTSTLSTGRVGLAYSRTLLATGGTTPRTWSVSAGALPTGLTLNATTGRITGRPTSAGAFAFTVMVTDAAGGTGTRALSITINP